MRRYTFALTIIGISALILIINFQEPIKITNQEEIEKLIPNTKIIIEGKVENQINYATISIIKINNFQIKCNCKQNYKNKKIEMEGIIEEYNDKKQIRALKINITT